jgi:hypothetical protein
LIRQPSCLHLRNPSSSCSIPPLVARFNPSPRCAPLVRQSFQPRPYLLVAPVDRLCQILQAAPLLCNSSLVTRRSVPRLSASRNGAAQNQGSVPGLSFVRDALSVLDDRHRHPLFADDDTPLETSLFVRTRAVQRRKKRRGSDQPFDCLCVATRCRIHQTHQTRLTAEITITPGNSWTWWRMPRRPR